MSSLGTRKDFTEEKRGGVRVESEDGIGEKLTWEVAMVVGASRSHLGTLHSSVGWKQWAWKAA